MNEHDDEWVAKVQQHIQEFVAKHAKAYALNSKQQSAVFEIGCLLLLIDDYEAQGYDIHCENLTKEGEFRYLTSPNGNPHNFSHVIAAKRGDSVRVRQQVRIRSHIHNDITFTPDFVVCESDAEIKQTRDVDYASGRRGLFAMDSSAVVASHECKSLPGFPELYVSFLGTILAGHPTQSSVHRSHVGHIAPTLFVGGDSSNLHLRMIAAMEESFPINIVTGLHRGTWIVKGKKARMNRLDRTNAAVR